MAEKRHKYFGQNGEDYLLWQVLGDKANGFYIDVGAFDGIHLSNSYSFELDGWQGVCVEPLPEFYEICKQNRPEATCVQAACVDDPQQGVVEMRWEKMGVLSGIRGDLDEDDVRQRHEDQAKTFEGFKTIEVDALTLDQIIEAHMPPGTELDFVSIDVEGSETRVLRGFDIQKHRPRLVVLEANSDEALAELDQIMVKEHGYHVGRLLSFNAFYARDPEDAAAARDLEINCWIEPNLHPYGEDYTPPCFVTGVQIGAGNKVPGPPPSPPPPPRRSLWTRLRKRLAGR